jgi:hypothetical protein
MVIVRFNQWEEFRDELGAHPPEDHTVRLTLSIRYDKQDTPFVTLVAGYLDRDTIVEFVHYLGLQPRDAKSARAKEIQQIFDERKRLLEAEGFRVRPGRYHVPPTQR